MIIDLIDKLIDRCIQLVKEHKQVKLRLFVDFVDPVYQQFQTVHQGYLASFKEYRNILKTDGGFSEKVAEVTDKVKEDNLFSSDQRAKVLQLSQLDKNDEFGNFVSSIEAYLLEATWSITGTEGAQNLFPAVLLFQLWRNSLVKKLVEILDTNTTEEDMQNQSINELDSIVEALQRADVTVTENYMKLKTSLNN